MRIWLTYTATRTWIRYAAPNIKLPVLFFLVSWTSGRLVFCGIRVPPQFLYLGRSCTFHVERHGLSTQPSLAPLKVSMGDGTTYDCQSSLVHPCLTMGPLEDDSWTFNVAPLQGVDVILGTPWWQKCTIRTLRIIRNDVQYAYLFVFLKRILPRHEK
jgi:hypothetical protein